MLKLTAQPLAPCENEVVGTMTLEIKALPVITLFETSSSLCESDPIIQLMDQLFLIPYQLFGQPQVLGHLIMLAWLTQIITLQKRIVI